MFCHVLQDFNGEFHLMYYCKTGAFDCIVYNPITGYAKTGITVGGIYLENKLHEQYFNDKCLSN